MNINLGNVEILNISTTVYHDDALSKFHLLISPVGIGVWACSLEIPPQPECATSTY